MKRENRKLKHNSNVIHLPRAELKAYKNKTFKVELFITNTFNPAGTRRLVKQIKFDKYYIDHLWMLVRNIGNLDHGYCKLDVKVKEYKNQETNQIKYGLVYTGKKGNKYIDSKLHKPKWKKE